MRLMLGTLLTLLTLVLLAGCGTEQADDGSSSESPTPSPTPSQTQGEPVPDGPVDSTLVALVSASFVGGAVSPKASVLDSDEALAAFAGQFEDERMNRSLDQEVAASGVPDGETLLAAVVAIGCEAPEEVVVHRATGGVRITAEKVVSKMECLVPVTTVALVSVDDAVL